MNTYVYVDGFNLYYGAVKGTPYKWLNIFDLCQRLLRKNTILKIKYFTAPQLIKRIFEEKKWIYFSRVAFLALTSSYNF